MKINAEALAKLPEEQRAEVEARINKVRKAYEANPLLRFHPHEGQDEYLGISTRTGALFCGNRFGKTCVGLVWDIIQCLDMDAVPEHLQQYKHWDPREHGPIKGRICAPKYINIEGTIFPELLKWVPRNQLKGGGWGSGFSASRRLLTFENGSTIQFLTYDQDVDAHSGAALHFIHFDEEPDGAKGLQLYRENTTRLADYNGQFRLTMTPLFGLSWAYDEIWTHRLEDSRITAIQADTYNNTSIPHAGLRADEAAMTREERLARRQGKFVHFAGQFYPEFGDKHLVDPPTPRHIKGQDVIVGIDPGLNFTGVVWVAFDNENCALVFDELKAEQMIVEDVAEKIKEINKLWGIDPLYYVIDPSARNRSMINAEAVEGAYTRSGITPIPGQNDRSTGILEVKRRLQHGPGLFVSKTCTNLANEFERYRRDPNSSDEFAAVKINDHELDALRYVCMERVWIGPRAREEEGYPDHWVPGTAPPAEFFEQNVSKHPFGGLV